MIKVSKNDNCHCTGTKKVAGMSAWREKPWGDLINPLPDPMVPTPLATSCESCPTPEFFQSTTPLDRRRDWQRHRQTDRQTEINSVVCRSSL